MTNLVKLLDKLTKENSDVDEISVTLFGKELKMEFNPSKDFESYEVLIANPNQKNYMLGYFGGDVSVQNTFLSQKYSKYIENSSLLKEFRKKVSSRKGLEDGEYLPMSILGVSYENQEELEDAFISMSRIFLEKTMENYVKAKYPESL